MYVCACMRFCVYVCMSVCMYVHMCVYVCMHVFMYMCVCMYVCVHEVSAHHCEEAFSQPSLSTTTMILQHTHTYTHAFTTWEICKIQLAATVLWCGNHTHAHTRTSTPHPSPPPHLLGGFGSILSARSSRVMAAPSAS